MSIPIFGFIHVMQVNHWRDILKEFIDQIESSGLYQKVDRIYVGFLGLCPDYALPPQSKYVVAFHHPDVLEYEYPTLSKLREICEQYPAAKVFYMHTKGVTKPQDWQEQNWRRNMVNIVVQQWQVCLWALDTWDIAGGWWVGTCFFGNFWWANASYILGLPDLKKKSPPTRFEAEVWIGRSDSKRAFEVQNHWGKQYSGFQGEEPLSFKVRHF